jgi:hypothetical protein
MDTFKEQFDINGAFVLVGYDEIVQYEVIMDPGFLCIEQGAWKFVFKYGKDTGLETYTRNRVHYETIEHDILNVYKDYILFDELEGGFQKIRHIPGAYAALLHKSKIMLKLQRVFLKAAGQFSEAFSSICS